MKKKPERREVRRKLGRIADAATDYETVIDLKPGGEEDNS